MISEYNNTARHRSICCFAHNIIHAMVTDNRDHTLLKGFWSVTCKADKISADIHRLLSVLTALYNSRNISRYQGRLQNPAQVVKSIYASKNRLKGV